MANDEHVALLKQGVAAWNAWREENPGVDVDLSGANLSRATLFYAKLSGADLSKAILIGADLSGANLSGELACDYEHQAERLKQQWATKSQLRR
jgi:uncharacterized protein YjbI with pentapeptide repeats